MSPPPDAQAPQEAVTVPGELAEIRREQAAINRRMDLFAAEMSANTACTQRVEDGLGQLRTSVQELVTIWQAAKGFGTVTGWLSTGIKRAAGWGLAIVLGGAVWTRLQGWLQAHFPNVLK